MKKNKIPTIVGVVILVLGIALGVFFIQNRQIFKLGASPTTLPKDVRVTNLSDSSFTVSWTTEAETEGFVKWGSSQSLMDKTAVDEIESGSFTHTVTIRSLQPTTTYFFEIGAGTNVTDNNGVPWQAETGVTLPLPQSSSIASGTVVSSTGATAQNALVYISIPGASPLSEITSQNGSFIVPLSAARTSALSSFAEITGGTLLEVFVQAGPSGESFAKVYAESANPIPTMILGQSHDFRDVKPGSEAGSPEASLNLPEDTETESGFDVGEELATPSATSVTLDSLEEGEIVTSQKPEFFGVGPTGAEITVTVESEAQTGTATVDETGTWNWSAPESLSEGAHKITVSWRDASGILRTLSRTFIVQAAEGPAFESTPSGETPTPSPSATASASPTATPKATSSASPSAIPTAIPDSGVATPTIALMILGLALVSFSIVAFLQGKKS